ncbi:unnamed protein product [Auanema sp. JU1783]|nr:unnamed protein product [Auanema sp. JU1783]
MASSAAPPNQRREDYASSHPQHLLHQTHGTIPSSDSEPLSVRDGFIPFSIGNSSIAKEQSRNTFYNLIGHDVEANPPIIIADKPKKKNRKPGRRKPALSGRTQALQILLDEPTEQRCEGQKFKQRVRVAGCLTKTIINRFCFGTCASYFIPRMSTNKLKAFFKSCSTCGPKEYDSVNVTLDCPGQDPPQITQSIIKVKKCACINVDLNS